MTKSVKSIPTSEIEATRRTLARQLRELIEYDDAWLACSCGRRITLRAAYRCRECAVWFCGRCSLGHFDMEVGSNGGVVKKTEKT